MSRWVCLDIGEVLVDETRIWSTWADVLDIPRFTFMAAMGAVIAAGGDHRDAFTRLGVDDWQTREPQVQAAYGGFRSEDLYGDVLSALEGLWVLDVSVAIIGNQPARRAQELAELGVLPDIMAMSETIGVEKPDPAFFRAALAIMGDPTPGDVLYIGDRLDNDIAPARRAGLHAAWLRRGPWGRIPPLAAGAEATLVLDSLFELPARLREVW